MGAELSTAHPMRDFIAIAKALSDPSRARVLPALSVAGELCVCQVVELLDLAPSTVSRHLSILAQARLVDWRKDGRWAYYRLANRPGDPPEARQAIAWTLEHLEGDATIVRDLKRLQAILAMTPEQLVEAQSRREGRACCLPGECCD